MPTLFPSMGGLLEDKRQENIKQSRHIEYSYDTNDLLVIFKRERCPGIKLSARKTLFCTFCLYVRYQDINTSMYTHLIAMKLDECPWCWFSLLQFNCLDNDLPCLSLFLLNCYSLCCCCYLAHFLFSQLFELILCQLGVQTLFPLVCSFRQETKSSWIHN